MTGSGVVKRRRRGGRPHSSSTPCLINISRKSRDFSHGMDRSLLSPFMGLFVCFCIFFVIDIFLDNFFVHIAQCTHIVTRRPKMTAPILATSYSG
ncbi:tRNA/rRNA methyltransferase [Limosilactobacillus fermentum L930BB]|nr:tRNA/rRNA methyltransferase [Limosilactobacillus fermentum L930BB]